MNQEIIKSTSNPLTQSSYQSTLDHQGSNNEKLGMLQFSHFCHNFPNTFHFIPTYSNSFSKVKKARRGEVGSREVTHNITGP